MTSLAYEQRTLVAHAVYGFALPLVAGLSYMLLNERLISQSAAVAFSYIPIIALAGTVETKRDHILHFLGLETAQVFSGTWWKRIAAFLIFLAFAVLLVLPLFFSEVT